MADAAVEVATALVEDGEAPPTVPEWYARWSAELGIADPDETEEKLVERA